MNTNRSMIWFLKHVAVILTFQSKVYLYMRYKLFLLTPYLQFVSKKTNKHVCCSSVHQCDDKDFRGPSWRRQFPPRDVHGISMMPGSAETLPAGFRLTATSGHSRRLPPEGKPPSLHLISHVTHVHPLADHFFQWCCFIKYMTFF